MRIELSPLYRRFLYAATVLTSGISALAQSDSCPVAAARTATPASAAYAERSFAKAEDLYGQAVAQHPQDVELNIGLIQTWLHEGEVSQASLAVHRLVTQGLGTAQVLTALAEVQLQQGLPWLAVQTLNSAANADPCYGRVHLIRSRIFRLDSMYASERKEIRSAYTIDPTEPDIRHAWLNIVTPADDIVSTQKSLAANSDIDPDVRKKAEASMASMMPLLFETSQTCRVVPDVPSATLPLLAVMQDGKHIDAYQLDVQLPKTRVKLTVDTAASGLYISRALADANGLEQGVGAPSGTVHVDSLHIGPLEFRDCMVGVSETPFSNKVDGFIGTDIFASYLITLDQPDAKLLLAPLPPQSGLLPGDRSEAPELSDYSPVYHRLQYLLLPVLLNNKEKRLFALDTGIRLTAMTAYVAHSVSNTRVNFTNAVQTTSGAALQLFRDSFDFEFAGLLLRHQSHVLEFDPTAMEQNAGFKMGGMLGFDMLHSMILHLDYRDGLVKLVSSDAAVSPLHGGTAGASPNAASSSAAPAPECEQDQGGVRPLSDTLETKVGSFWDSGHLKVGEQLSVQVMREWLAPTCRLVQGANLYGRVTAAASSKNPGKAQLGLVFDHADCYGKGKTAISMAVLGVVAAPGEFKGLQSVTPSLVNGSTRQVTSAVAAIGFPDTINLNPGGPPHTVQPGIVAGIPTMKLDPVGGLACSAVLTSTERSVQLGVGTELILTLAAPTPATP